MVVGCAVKETPPHAADAAAVTPRHRRCFQARNAMAEASRRNPLDKWAPAYFRLRVGLDNSLESLKKPLIRR